MENDQPVLAQVRQRLDAAPKEIAEEFFVRVGGKILVKAIAAAREAAAKRKAS